MSENEKSKKVEEATKDMVSEGGVPEAEREALPAEEALEQADEPDTTELPAATDSDAGTPDGAASSVAGAEDDDASAGGDSDHAALVAAASAGGASGVESDDDEVKRLLAQGIEPDKLPNATILAVVLVLSVGVFVIGLAVYQVTRYVAQNEFRERYASVVDPSLLEVRERNLTQLRAIAQDEESGEYRIGIDAGKELLLANPAWINRHPLGSETVARDLRQDAAGSEGASAIEAAVVPTTLEDDGETAVEETGEDATADDRESGEASPDAGEDEN